MKIRILFLFILGYLESQAQPMTLTQGGKSASLITDLPSRTPVMYGKNDYTFTVPAGGAAVSASLYNAANHKLVANIFQNVHYDAGTYTRYYDGTLEFPQDTTEEGGYFVKVMTNQVQATWEGTIGNTSTAATGLGIWHTFGAGYKFFECNTRMMVAATYNEGNIAELWFNKTTPQIVNYNNPDHRHLSLATSAGCSDGIRNYWGGTDGYNPNLTGVFVTDAVSDQVAILSAGTPFGLTYYSYVSGCDITTTGVNPIYAMAVTKTKNYLYVSRPLENKIHILNKSTGALIGTFDIENPRDISMFPDDNAIMCIYAGGTIERLEIGTGGFLTNSLKQITTVDNPLAVSIDPTGRVGVVDGAPSNQVKIFTESAPLDTKLIYNVDFSIFDPFTTPNVPEDNNYKTYATDNDLNTVYYGNAIGGEAAMVLNCGEEGKVVNYIRFYFKQEDWLGGLEGGSIEVSNGAPFSGSFIAEIAGLHVGWNDIYFENTTAYKYYRIKHYPNILINEVELYNTQAGGSDGYELALTVGTAGGYANGPLVTDTKFCFLNPKYVGSGEYSTLTFQSDGSFWVCDFSANRMVHFSALGDYLEQVQQVGFNYSTYANGTNPNRITANYLEYEVDYSKPISPTNESWILKYNWIYNVINSKDDQFNRLSYFTTLKNGKTYCMAVRSDGKKEIVWMDENHGLRYTGFTTNDGNWALNRDGCLTGFSNNDLGRPAPVYRRDLLGFDGNSKPVYSAIYQIATTPNITTEHPVNLGNAGMFSNMITDSKKVLYFAPDRPNFSSKNMGSGFHLGGVKVGDTAFQWLTCYSTGLFFNGEMGTDGSFDIGNGVEYAGGVCTTLDNIVLWNYHGEKWKANDAQQTNYFWLFDDNGQMITRFGVRGYMNDEAPAGMAGNAITLGFTKDGAGNYYVYYPDESHHGGVGRYKITGISTIQYQDCILRFAKPIDQKNAGDKITQGLLWNYDITSGEAGFLLGPSVGAVTGRYSTDKKAPDLQTYIFDRGVSSYVSKELTTTQAAGSWSLDGKMVWPGEFEWNGGGHLGRDRIQILDNTGKVIFELSKQILHPYKGLYYNNTSYVYYHIDDNNPDNDEIGLFCKVPQPFEIKYVAAAGSVAEHITFSYGPYGPYDISASLETGANMAFPAKLNIQYITEPLNNIGVNAGYRNVFLDTYFTKDGQ